MKNRRPEKKCRERDDGGKPETILIDQTQNTAHPNSQGRLAQLFLEPVGHPPDAGSDLFAEKNMC